MLRCAGGLLVMVAVTVAGGCSGEVAKDATAAVVGKGIEVGKGTVTGIASGIAEGRKNAESADGAVVVSSDGELKSHGGVALGAIVAAADGADVPILFENKGDKPMRVTGIDVLVLDKDSIVVPLTRRPDVELTVPPRARARALAGVGIPPEKIGTVRVYGVDVPR